MDLVTEACFDTDITLFVLLKGLEPSLKKAGFGNRSSITRRIMP